MMATSTDMTTMTVKAVMTAAAAAAAGASSTGSRQDMSRAAGMFFRSFHFLNYTNV